MMTRWLGLTFLVALFLGAAALGSQTATAKFTDSLTFKQRIPMVSSDVNNGPPPDCHASPSSSNKERALAESVILKLSDFPTGWTSDPLPASDFVAIFIPVPGETGSADSDVFSDGAGTAVSESSSVSATSADALAGLSRVLVGIDCLDQALAAGAGDADGVTLRNPRSTPLDVPAAVATSIGFRTTVDAEGATTGGGTVKVTVYVDSFIVVVGRMSIMLVVGSGGAEPDSAIEELLLNNAIARLSHERATAAALVTGLIGTEASTR